MPSNLYPGFNVPADRLSAFSFAIDTFIISLKDQTIVTHTCTDHAHFRQWLENMGIRNVQEFPHEPQPVISYTERDSGHGVAPFVGGLPRAIRLFLSRRSAKPDAITGKA